MNASDARDLVPEYVLGLLSERDRQKMAAAINRSNGRANGLVDGLADDLAEQVRLTEEAVATLAEALPAAPVSPGARVRLLDTLSGPDRFREFLAVLRAWFDLGDDALRSLLARVDGPAGEGWIAAPFPGVRYFDFEGGPRALAKQSGCLMLAPGAHFPRHCHLGGERALVLQGSLLLDGTERHAGDVVEAAAGTAHDFAAGPGRDLVLMVSHDGISFPA